jgi:hypothetical protein
MSVSPNGAGRLSRWVMTLASFGICAAGLGAQDGPSRIHNPLHGMDPDGRIERPDPPAEVVNPERWRYLPEARLQPGSVLERFLVTSFITPIIFREADIGVGGGVALTDVNFRDQRGREFANMLATYSEEGQQAFRINWARWSEHIDTGKQGVWREERGRIYGRAGYEKTLTRRYFGRGSRTSEFDETSYTEELATIGTGVRWSLPNAGDDWLLRTDVQLESHNLASGRVSSVPSSNSIEVPEIREEFLDADGRDQLWISANLAWDTRDSLHQPYQGSRIGVGASNAISSGSETGSLLSVDAQHVVQLSPVFHSGGTGREENPPTDVLVFSGYVQETVGYLPFFSLPNLGGSNTLRGYIDNRFTDRSAWHATAEYRVGIVPRGVAFTKMVRIERISLGFFYECGTVAAGVEKLSDGAYLDSYGLGLRFGFQREAIFRLDFGFCDEGSNFSLAFGHSF